MKPTHQRSVLHDHVPVNFELVAKIRVRPETLDLQTNSAGDIRNVADERDAVIATNCQSWWSNASIETEWCVAKFGIHMLIVGLHDRGAGALVWSSE